jgi:hypothetical protein
MSEDGNVSADTQAEPAHAEPAETIHIPPNSLWPVVTSVGVALTMIGIVTLSNLVVILPIGLIVLLAGVGGWVRDARKEHLELH